MEMSLLFQVHQIDFDDENNIINKNVFLHKEGEIWNISASPCDKQILATIYNNSKALSHHGLSSVEVNSILVN